ncbi:fumarylacetoacetate hydrolase family protein [Halosegnis longus]|uniref:FAA hydrolase family protein n=1 Tax=Halosegnis longus TaxID=2216012 RepID=A0AAJ4R7L3_9EURY|nr:fumarylacetoacetate hydrolase family protein [Halosegnis longus]RNJ25710.1 FAA hydrolase family protein [Salella cibi]
MTKYARVTTDDGVQTGEYDDGVVTTDDGEYVVGEDADLLAPCEPSAFYCVGRNYGEKVEQMGYDVPEKPDFFIKGPTSLLGPGEDIEYPSFTEELTYAGELAAVIGERCHDIDETQVDDAVWGYTIMNDLDALDQERRTARKAFDGSAPLGPVVADIDPVGLDIETYVGGELRQDDNTENMFIKPREVISFLSERFTFQPGDVISFGSPANPGLVEPGETVEITYEGIGTLSNTVV